MRSEEINELAAALAKAQGQMSNATWNRENPHFRSQYADLAAVVNAVRKPLSDNGIAVTQPMNDGILETYLIHSTGQWLSCSMVLPAVNKAQDLGSVLTYYRRYQLLSICGLGAEGDDDDANASAALQQKPPARRAPPTPGQNVMRQRPDYVLSTGPSHDPETGEVKSEEDDTSARASPAGPAAPSSEQGAAGSTVTLSGVTMTLSDAATANIKFLATEAAKRGREQLNTYFKGLPPEAKRVVTLMKDELEQILPPKT